MTNCLNVVLAGTNAVFPARAGREIAARAVGEGYAVRSLLLSGEKAGGGYACHLRIGSGPLSPVIPEGHADLLLSDTPWEALRQLSWLKKDGQVITLEDAAAVRKGFPAEPYLLFLKRRVRRLIVLSHTGDNAALHTDGNVGRTALHFHDIFDILCNDPAPLAAVFQPPACVPGRKAARAVGGGTYEKESAECHIHVKSISEKERRVLSKEEAPGSMTTRSARSRARSRTADR